MLKWHLDEEIKLRGENVAIKFMRKFYPYYLSGFENAKVLRFVDESAALCNPDRIVWIDGSKEQRDALRAEACASGEMIKLNEDLLPECYLHRTAVNDVARVDNYLAETVRLVAEENYAPALPKLEALMHLAQTFPNAYRPTPANIF